MQGAVSCSLAPQDPVLNPQDKKGRAPGESLNYLQRPNKTQLHRLMMSLYLLNNLQSPDPARKLRFHAVTRTLDSPPCLSTALGGEFVAFSWRDESHSSLSPFHQQACTPGKSQSAHELDVHRARSRETGMGALSPNPPPSHVRSRSLLLYTSTAKVTTRPASSGLSAFPKTPQRHGGPETMATE